MPFVRIEVTDRNEHLLPAVGDAVQAALVDAFAVPVEDRFQVRAVHPAARLVAGDHLGITHGPDVTFVQVFLREGRSADRKRTFYDALARRCRSAGLDPADVVAVLVGNGVADWSFGNGEAQYAPGPDTDAEGVWILGQEFGPGARDRRAETIDPATDGALAALETFYRALNGADLDLLSEVWSEHELAQLDNPVGGIVRSGAAVTDLYRRIFSSGIDVQVTFTDAVAYSTSGMVTFTGQEVGSYRDGGGRTELRIRTTRCFAYRPGEGRWRQVHHHGSIDDPAALARYQTAVGRPAA